MESLQKKGITLGKRNKIKPLSMQMDVCWVIEVNPDAFLQAEKADHERNMATTHGSLSPLHGIPKDNIATKNKLNTTAGSFELLEFLMPRDAGVVMKLRKGRAIILGKASLTEWSSFQSNSEPNGWSVRGGQEKVKITILTNI
ncbi:putative amidase At4g34880 [Nicotiana tabacum]|uniref:Amidase At4g34880 n=1 Tax=Nicotiana tabacum TaxID=4097 RepID=A0AC58UPJ8_TOBAC